MSKPLKEVRHPGHTVAETRVRAGGLRYQSKVGGSPFATDLGVTRSCFLCGCHRPRAALKMRKLIGRNETVCADDCGKR